MIQIQIGSTGVLILEPDTFDMLKAGRFLKVPVEYFRQPLRGLIIDYTPNVDWVAEEFAKLRDAEGDVLWQRLQQIIRDSRQQPEQRGRAKHGVINLLEKAHRA